MIMWIPVTALDTDLVTSSNRNCIFWESGQELSVSVCHKKNLGGVPGFQCSALVFGWTKKFPTNLKLSNLQLLGPRIDENDYMKTMTMLRLRRWSFFSNDAMVMFFSQGNIANDGFSMVLLLPDHHH